MASWKPYKNFYAVEEIEDKDLRMKDGERSYALICALIRRYTDLGDHLLDPPAHSSAPRCG